MFMTGRITIQLYCSSYIRHYKATNLSDDFRVPSGYQGFDPEPSEERVWRSDDVDLRIQFWKGDHGHQIGRFNSSHLDSFGGFPSHQDRKTRGSHEILAAYNFFFEHIGIRKGQHSPSHTCYRSQQTVEWQLNGSVSSKLPSVSYVLKLKCP